MQQGGVTSVLLHSRLGCHGSDPPLARVNGYLWISHNSIVSDLEFALIRDLPPHHALQSISVLVLIWTSIVGEKDLPWIVAWQFYT
jgi:hypothetical protein